ncbi:MAG: Vps62-related protein, partial [Anaerolineae bacterium]|nr:Vps62-related protein [Anaerolineae bacterium]
MKRYIFIFLCLVLLIPTGISYADTPRTPEIAPLGIPPLSSALHVLPPIGESKEKISNTDLSLNDFLLVSVCQVTEDGCSQVYEFTSQKTNKGLDYIKLQNEFYHVNWKVSKNDIGKSFEVHFSVSGLDIGHFDYIPKSGKTIPIRFHVDNHPRIRARVLHEQDYSAIDIAQALIDEFNLGAAEIAEIFYLEGYGAVETAQVLFNLGFNANKVGVILRDIFNLSAFDAGLVLKELGFSEFAIQSMLIAVYNTYAVIVDIKSTVNSEPTPSGYTGLTFCGDPEKDATRTRCTEPYIPGLFGQFVTASDINIGIGGDFRYVYVKYELVSKTSDQEVATGIMASVWDNGSGWQENCPGDWTPVSALTTKTDNSCARVGMCAEYQPFIDAEKFITTPAISLGDWGNPATKCSALCGANANIWPQYTDSQDIHQGCGDEQWVYFCYNQAEAWSARPITIDVTEDEKLTLLEQYAPLVYFNPEITIELGPASVTKEGERFYPSSVEWSFDHLFRYSPSDLPPFIPESNYDMGWNFNPHHLFPQPDNQYYVATKEMIESPSDWLEYHRGCDGTATDNPCQLSDAPAYAFWNKQIIPLNGQDIEVVDLTYFFYYPYNRGKEYFSTVWGNHVGDWEHITVRLGWVYNPTGGWEIKPIELLVSAHDFGTSHPWDTITKVPASDHPIVYSANGGHGNYMTSGTHRYGKIWIGPTPIFLYDNTGEGDEWNTWSNLETYDFDAEQGLGSSIWPRWMSTDY